MKRGLLVALVLFLAGVAQAATVRVNESVQYQTIIGWGTCAWISPLHTMASQQEIMKESVNELGLNSLRIGPGGDGGGNSTDRIAWDDTRTYVRGWEWENDNGDPDNINWSAFSLSHEDKHALHYLLPFKQYVEANGEPFNLFVSPGWKTSFKSGPVPSWIQYSPGEHIEHIVASLLHLKNTYNIEAKYCSADGEPGHYDPFTSAMIANVIKTMVPKLRALGFSTEIHFPDGLHGMSSWSYIQAVQSDSSLWPLIDLISYHLYGTNDPYRSYIRDFGLSKGIPTAMTEGMYLDINDLYDDLTLAGVSHWQLTAMGNCFKQHHNRVERVAGFWSFRQVMHYVRPGAIRIEATSDNSNLKVLAFTKNGKITVVLINGSVACTVDVNNLQSGTYGISQSVTTHKELGLQTVGASGTLTVNLPSNAVMTIYPYPGTNQPPTMTDWKSNSDFLTMPSNSTTLSASATDPELNPITYSWSVKSQPSGANVILGTSNAASTSATGLSVAGNYVFTVAVSDPTHTVTRDVRLTVFATNQPPLLFDVHNRNTTIITLPTSSTQLRAAALDLESDPCTFHWSIISQPVGANASLATPDSNTCDVSNMTVAGDYVFKIDASDPTHTVSDTLTVPVYPVNSNGPVISSAIASPDTLMLPTHSTSLSATTSDPDGDTISHWWSVKTTPSGAATPVFTKQGSPNTTVSNLTSVGTYKFTLTVVDRTMFTTKDVTINVLQASTYYLDAVNGDDNNPGTSAQPWKTLNRAYTWYSGAGPKVQEGDTVYFRDGDYGQFMQGTPTGESAVPRRNNWITYKAESGHAPVLSNVFISGEDKWSPIDHGKSYYVFDGFDIPDGVSIEYTSEVKVLNCKIHRQPNNIKGYFEPYFDAGAYGVSITGGVNVTIQGCDIYECYRGIRSITNDSNLVIADNIFHHISEDGFSVPSCNGLTISGNKIYDLRRFTTTMYIPGTINGTFNVGDTVTMPPDAVGIVESVGSNYVNVYATTGPNTFWHYWLADKTRILTGPTGTMSSITDVDPPHCDAMQIHGSATNILIENNYVNREIVVGPGSEDGQGIKFAGGASNIVLRNNLSVAGTPLYIEPATGIKIYNNTLVGIGHPVYGAEVRIFDGVEIDYMFNNIISRLSHGDAWIKNHGNNIFHYAPNQGIAHPFAVNGTEINGMSIASMDAMFVNAHAPNFNYHLTAGATAIDFGNPTYAPATDILGYPRDEKPDAGSYEYGAVPLKGDINKDGQVNIQDIQACVNHILGKQDWGTKADVNGDGIVDKSDLKKIINIILGE